MNEKNIAMVLFIGLMSSLVLLAFVMGAFEDNLLSYWKLDGTSGAVIDSVGVIDGTNFGATRGVEGIVNTAFRFDGDNDFVNISSTDGRYGSGNLTIALWINKSGAGEDGQTIIDRRDGSGSVTSPFTIAYSRTLHDISFATTRLDGSTEVSVRSANNIQNDTWTFVTATYNNETGNQSIYINGTIVDSEVDLVGLVNPSSRSMTIGARDQGAASHFNGTIDEVRIWNRVLSATEIINHYDGITGLSNISVVIDSPENDTTFFDSTSIFNGTIQSFGNNFISNATLWVYNSTGEVHNNSLKETFSEGQDEVVTSLNYTFDDEGSFLWNILACTTHSDSNPTSCTFGESNRSFNFGLGNISQNQTATTFETDNVFYNVTFNSVSTPSATLFYNGTAKTGTVTNIANNLYRADVTFVQPPAPTEPIGTKGLFWSISNSGGSFENTSVQTQSNDPINLTLCGGAPQNIPYINFTYKNETTAQEEVTAFVSSSTWQYNIGDDRTFNKTLSFSDGSETVTHEFCFSPPDRTLTTSIDYSYDNSESQQRKFTSTEATLTSNTLDKVLFLLPTDEGIFSKFSVIDSNGNPLSQVKAEIERSLGGSTVEISSAFTDTSGFVNFFLNPDVTYTATFSKAGFANEVFTFTPTVDIRTVILGGGAGNIGNGTQIASNTTYQIFPLNNTLPNQTDITFGFNVTSSESITFISMNITNSTGDQIAFNSNAGTGFITSVANTGNNSFVKGVFVIRTSGEEFSVTKRWTIGADFIGDYSFFRQFNLFNDYDFSDFWRMLLVLFFIGGVMIFLSTNEVLDSSESKIAVAVLLVWVFSIVGWLDTGLVVSSQVENINKIGELGNQYGIAILTTATGASFVLRRLFT